MACRGRAATATLTMAVGGAQVALRSRAAAPEALSPQQRVIAQSRAPVVSPKPFTAARAPPPRAAAGTRTEADASLQASTSAAAQVVLTREQGKNGKLRKVLEKLGVSCLEMPLVETAAGPDRQQLAELLRQEAQQFDWVCVTSPEAAKVFVEAWRQAGTPAVRIAVVGDGTGRVLVEAEGEALKPQFLPSVVSTPCLLPLRAWFSMVPDSLLVPARCHRVRELRLCCFCCCHWHLLPAAGEC